MKRMIFLILSFTAILIIIGLFAGCSEGVKSQPVNFVFILADDLGWNQVGYQGSDFYETPNIDRISREGIHFTNAYSSAPVCSPTRAGLMTGKHPARLHITDYIPGSPYPYARLTTPQQAACLPLEEITIAEKLKEKGYISGHFGKWHLAPDKNYQPGRPFDPGSQGFDVVFTTVKPEENTDPNKDAHHTIEITEKSLKFLDQYGSQAFFLYVSYHAVHRPIMETAELIAKYQAKDGADLPQHNPIMGAMIERMDTGIGQILQKLEDLKIKENTVVFFYSDNGGLKELQDQYPLRGGKAMIFDGGLRVPLTIRWPGVIPANIRSEELVCSEDFFPTIMEIASISYDNNSLDGESLIPVLKQVGKLSRQALYFHYPHYHHQGYKPASAIRQGDYKLIEWFEESLVGMENRVNLYNLREDIGEKNDLSSQMPDKTAELYNKLHEWRKAIGAQEMEVNPNYDSKKANLRFSE
jgi:arylsulfatase A